MFDFASVLKENPNGVFATLDGDKICMRMMQFQFAQGKNIYFSTTRNKAVYEQIKANPQAAFCVSSKEYSNVISIYGKVVLDDDIALKTRMINENPLLKDIYKTPGNPDLAVFYMTVEEVENFISNEGLKKYLLQ
jgi:uncharacterized pyridoxamine 5'-phosphate oxidase family protein